MLELMPESFWVVAGAVVTFALAAAMSFWIDQEWRELDPRREGPPEPPASAPSSDFRPLE